MDDKELDKFISEELKKDIDQSDSIDKKQVEDVLGQMGFLWDNVQRKLNDDHFCFKCKKDVDLTKEKIRVLIASGSEKGVAAFVSVCEPCHDELEEASKKEN